MQWVEKRGKCQGWNAIAVRVGAFLAERPLIRAYGGRSDGLGCGRSPTGVRDSHGLDLDHRPACPHDLKQPLLRAHRAQILSASTAATSNSAESGRVLHSAIAKEETSRVK